MRFVLFKRRGAPQLHVGALVGGLKPTAVADISAAWGSPLSSMRAFLEAGEAGRTKAAAALAAAGEHVPIGDVELRAPIYDAEKVICVGMNYVDHCTEQGLPIPVEPVIFNKFPTSISASGDPLVMPPETSELDYEVELAIVVGKEGRRVPKERAYEYIAGYAVAHDVSARDWQLKKNGGQWLLGKAGDGFSPLGPAIVTPDEVGDVHALRLTTVVNGVTLQDGNTKELVHKVPDLIAWITKFITLKPGDVILTGTPPGVGCFRKPQLWLKAGDVVTVEIEKLGAVTNTVVAEDAAAVAR